MGSKNRLFSRIIRQFNNDLTIKTASLETEAQVTTTTISTQVDSAVAQLVSTAPATLDTLDELAAALGDDANFATTVTNSLATKASIDYVDSAVGAIQGFSGSYDDLTSVPFDINADISKIYYSSTEPNIGVPGELWYNPSDGKWYQSVTNPNTTRVINTMVSSKPSQINFGSSTATVQNSYSAISGVQITFSTPIQLYSFGGYHRILLKSVTYEDGTTYTFNGTSGVQSYTGTAFDQKVTSLVLIVYSYANPHNFSLIATGAPLWQEVDPGYSTLDSAGVTGLIDSAVSALINSAPDALNTLDELAAALGDDSNFATTVTNSLATKADTSSLATVATSGSYNDLSNKPTIPADVSDLTDTTSLLGGSDALGTATTSGDNITLDLSTGNHFDIDVQGSKNFIFSNPSQVTNFTIFTNNTNQVENGGRLITTGTNLTSKNFSAQYVNGIDTGNAKSHMGIAINNDGTKVYLGEHQNIRQYTLSTPYDLSTIDYANPDGALSYYYNDTKRVQMLQWVTPNRLLVYGSNGLAMWTFATNYDITSTATSRSFGSIIFPTNNSVNCVFCSADGMELYYQIRTGTYDYQVIRYRALDDYGTRERPFFFGGNPGKYVNQTLNLGNVGNWNQIWFSNDGLWMSSNISVYQLTTAWDISTASLYSSSTVSVTAFHFSEDESKVFYNTGGTSTSQSGSYISRNVDVQLTGANVSFPSNTVNNFPTLDSDTTNIIKMTTIDNGSTYYTLSKV